MPGKRCRINTENNDSTGLANSKYLANKQCSWQWSIEIRIMCDSDTRSVIRRKPKSNSNLNCVKLICIRGRLIFQLHSE